MDHSGIGQYFLKHSGADKAKIRIKRNDQSPEAIISDNGRGFQTEEGFNVKSNVQNPKLEGGFGLIGVRERIELIDGKAEINTAPGRGTELKITIIK